MVLNDMTVDDAIGREFVRTQDNILQWHPIRAIEYLFLLRKYFLTLSDAYQYKNF